MGEAADRVIFSCCHWTYHPLIVAVVNFTVVMVIMIIALVIIITVIVLITMMIMISVMSVLMLRITVETISTSTCIILMQNY